MRALSAEESALWERVTREVRAFRARPVAAPAVPATGTAIEKPARTMAPRPKPVLPAKPARPGTTLDGSWDRRLARGEAAPDITIDLHGHDLAGAYGAVDAGLARAIGRSARVVLLITGRPPANAKGPIKRGAIRAAIDDWLHASRHAAHIAAVRNAAPRHGGEGALYIVLRKTG